MADPGDCSGDGRPDILAILARKERFICYPGQGNGYFSRAFEMLNAGHDYDRFRFVKGDVNGDGRIDVVAVRPDLGGDVVVWLNDGGSRFKTGVGMKWPGVVTKNYIFQLKDVDGDRKADLIAISPAEEKFVWYRSYGMGFVAPSVWYDGPNSYLGWVF